MLLPRIQAWGLFFYHFTKFFTWLCCFGHGNTIIKHENFPIWGSVKASRFPSDLQIESTSKIQTKSRFHTKLEYKQILLPKTQKGFSYSPNFSVLPDRPLVH